MNTWIIKLGGSVITNKHEGTAQVNTELLSALCKNISHIIQPNLRLIIVHGGGSFGHPFAHKYDLCDKPVNSKRLFGMARTISSMRMLTDTVAQALHSFNVPAIPLQTSSIFHITNKKSLKCPGQSIITHIMNAGGIPILCGDVALTSNNHTTIISADDLAVFFARAYQSKRVLFATDVDGVYPEFPPERNSQPLDSMTRHDLESCITSSANKQTSIDVTGGMTGKLQSLLPLQNTHIVIFNGTNPASFQKALSEDVVGTHILL